MEKFANGLSSIKALDAYIPLFEIKNSDIKLVMGKNSTCIYLTDPKLILFTLAKYKFASKMIGSNKKVIEVGCMDGFTSIFLKSYVENLTSIDFYKDHIEHAIRNYGFIKNLNFEHLDFLNSTYLNEFEALVTFDVLEHIDPNQADLFVKNCSYSLIENGICIIGMPSVESQVYASDVNKNSHINCMSVENANKLFGNYFRTILNFSMNDEIIHTGYNKMAHYNIYVMVK
jgi:2-polyprenyl-3-methyl-5-hydroxy-6-metoxy-1,4-benzoquinol methylase